MFLFSCLLAGLAHLSQRWTFIDIFILIIVDLSAHNGIIFAQKNIANYWIFPYATPNSKIISHNQMKDLIQAIFMHFHSNFLKIHSFIFTWQFFTHTDVYKMNRQLRRFLVKF